MKKMILICICAILLLSNPPPVKSVEITETVTTLKTAGKLKLSRTKVSLEAGDTVKLKVKNSKKKVSWTSSDPSVATVNSKGKVKAKSSGRATIAASSNGKTGTCTVTVIEKGFEDCTKAYTALNKFRTRKKQWMWNPGNKSKTYFNAAGKEKLRKLIKDADLEKTARIRAKEISQYFSHTRPDGTICDTAYPGKFHRTSEMLTAMMEDPEDAIAAYAEEDQPYERQGHRRAMLSSEYTAVGIACYRYHGICYWVVSLGGY